MQKEFIQSLRSSGVKFIRTLWCDNANIIRGKAIHIGALEQHLDYGVGISAAQQAIPVMYDAVVPGTGLGPVGEVRLMPDWSSYSPLPYAPEHARVIGDMYKNGKEWPYCSRNFLKKMINSANNNSIEIRGAYENEFYLLRNTPELIPADNTVFASTQSMDIHQDVINEIVEALLSQGISVEQYYPESGPGQQEISIKYTNALKIADNQIAFRETVKAIAYQQGLKASFLPKIFFDKAGSGCHLHISLWDNGKSLISDPEGNYGLSKTACHFIAGILHHLPALMAVTTPITNSYRRILPHYWSGAFRCWGLDNREAAVRVITEPSGSGISHFEFKTVDASSNPYLALGAVIAAGLDGIKKEYELGKPMDIDPGNLTVEKQNLLGIDPLPDNLALAIENIAKDEILLEAFGPELSKAYIAVKRAELEEMKDLSLPEEVNLLLEKY
jgi:glutamine synthetase